MSKVTPIDKQYVFDDKVIISQTDPDGIITYANRMFCEVSSYSLDELLEHSHNIVRHPDMPRAVFTKMWETIKSGQVWNGLVKNLRKDGMYYWVDTEILPIQDDEGNISGYIAARRPASQKDITENEELYAKMLEAEK